MKPTESSSPPHGPAPRPSRRTFIKDSSLLVAGGAVAGPLSFDARVHAHGSDEIRLGVVGCGQRGTALVHQALGSAPNVKLIAMADLFADRLQASFRGLKGRYRSQMLVARERQFVGFDACRRLLETDIDIVILATPPAFHPLYLEAAVRSRKHAFLEQPVAVDPVGVRRILQASQAAERCRLIVSCGFAHRQQESHQQTIQQLRRGVIGEAVRARVAAGIGFPPIRPRHKRQSALEFQLRNWRRFPWLSGDAIVEGLVKYLDLINWAQDSYPMHAQGQGSPLTASQEPGDDGNPSQVEFTYEDGCRLHGQWQRQKNTGNHATALVFGTRGTADLDAAVIRDPRGNVRWSYGDRRPAPLSGISQFLESFRTEANAPDETHGVGSTLTAILGRMATQSEHIVTWDQAVTSAESLAPIDQYGNLEDPQFKKCKQRLFRAAWATRLSREVLRAANIRQEKRDGRRTTLEADSAPCAPPSSPVGPATRHAKKSGWCLFEFRSDGHSYFPARRISSGCKTNANRQTLGQLPCDNLKRLLELCCCNAF